MFLTCTTLIFSVVEMKTSFGWKSHANQTVKVIAVLTVRSIKTIVSSSCSHIQIQWKVLNFFYKMNKLNLYLNIFFYLVQKLFYIFLLTWRYWIIPVIDREVSTAITNNPIPFFIINSRIFFVPSSCCS